MRTTKGTRTTRTIITLIPDVDPDAVGIEEMLMQATLPVIPLSVIINIETDSCK